MIRFPRHYYLVVVCLVLAFGTVPVTWSRPGVASGDWPQWRYDAERTAVTPHKLAPELHLQWIREFPPPQPAWPKSQTHLQFDASYEPVVLGHSIFVPSSVTDSVTAFDTRSGTETWRFNANGPVRFAPVAYANKLYVASDDGNLYCLNASSGDVLWTFRGGPDDRKVIGNGRLISMWPARGGPVLYDNVVYFAAGIWSFMGVFIHALDSETGEVIWTNSESGHRWTVQPHFSPAFAGVSPQGYLAATEDVLLVAGGRSVPAAFDRRTGEVLYFHLSSLDMGKGRGGYAVTAAESWFANGGVMYGIRDGQSLLKVEDAFCTPRTIYSIREDGLFFARPPRVALNRATETEEEPSYSLKETLRMAPDPDFERILLKAGNCLYGSASNGTVVAVSAGRWRKPRIFWRTRVAGTPSTAIVGDDRLFVGTQEGHLSCFGREEVNARRYSLPAAVPSTTTAGPAERARAILDAAGTDGGYAVVLGLSDDNLVVELARQSELHIVAIDPDPQRIAALRRRVEKAGWYGSRVHLLQGELTGSDLPPYLANVLVAGMGQNVQPASLESLYEILRPYGGTACVAVPSEQREEFRSLVQAAELPGVELAESGDLFLLRRAGKLAGSAPWTHESADAANTTMSKDKRVRAPLGVLWFGGPANDPVLPRHGHGPAPQVVGGRLYIEGRDMLRAVDVYTGRVLWEKPLPGLGLYYDSTLHQAGANEIGSNYVSLEDSLYVILPRACLRLDPATGETLSEFTLPAPAGGRAPVWGSLSAWDDLLIATSSPIYIPPSDMADVPPLGMQVLIPREAQWEYLAGADPPVAWAQPDVSLEGWKTGKAAFGRGVPVNTTLADMMHNYRSIYIRRTFELDDPADIAELALMVRYNDGFIAYLNGNEVMRLNVEEGSGPTVDGIGRQRAMTYRFHDITKHRGLLCSGQNVLAIEGHNEAVWSWDFLLDPYVVVRSASAGEESGAQDVAQPAIDTIDRVDIDASYASASRDLVVLSRTTGDVLWSRRAQQAFRHNAIATGNGKIFCIDALSQAKVAYLKRRGLTIDLPRVLYSLDARTGRVLWQRDEDIFGTWLAYSEEHDILLQAGSRSGDRAADEVGSGMSALRGADGFELWKDMERTYRGPCILRHDSIVSQGSAFNLQTGQEELREHPLTGEPLPWQFRKQYGCGTAIGSEHLLTFRSAAAGIYDLGSDSGTGNLGGFKSGCTPNLIPADGVLNAPDYTRTCTCSYQNQSSLALIHMPDVETWTFHDFESERTEFSRIKQIGLNLGAPGDRRADDGTLWLEFPIIGGPSPHLDIEADGKPEYFGRHSSAITDGELPWVAASGVEGVASLTVGLQLAPVHGSIDDAFSIRWTGSLTAPRSGDTTFYVAKDDGVRLWIGDTLVIDRWNTRMQEVKGTIRLEAGQSYAFRMEYFDRSGKAGAILSWEGRSLPKTVIDSKYFSTEDGQPGGLTGRYFSDQELSSRSVTQTDPQINFDWGTSAPTAVKRVRTKPDGSDDITEMSYTVRLIFAELLPLASGERVFDVALQGEQVLHDFDIVKEAGGPCRSVIREFRGVRAGTHLKVSFLPKTGRPLLCGIEAVMEP